MKLIDIFLICFVCGVVIGAYAVRRMRKKNGKSSCCSCGRCDGSGMKKRRKKK